MNVIDNDFLNSCKELENEKFKGNVSFNLANAIHEIVLFLNNTSKSIVEKSSTTSNSFYESKEIENTQLQKDSKLEDVEIYQQNIKKVKDCVVEENKSFEYFIDSIKQTLDSLTDVMENSSLLSLENFEELIKYLDKNKNVISENINNN